MTLHRLVVNVPAAILRTLAIFGVALGLTALLPPPALAQAQSARELVMTVGKSLVVNSAAPIERVSVGFGDVAEARAVGPQEVLLDAKTPGETTLIIWQQGGSKLFFDVIVRPNGSVAQAKIDVLRRQLKELLPGQNITAVVENDAVFLTGTANDLSSAERAVAIAATAGKVTNLLYVNVPATDKQILLKVQFATIDHTATTELGANLVSLGGANTIGRATTGQFAPPVLTQSPNQPPQMTLSDALNVFLFRPDLNLAATIKALQTSGNVQILAEPNVLAINGKPASFLAGGEFPYPILQGGGGGVGTVTVAFREFGVRINFLPMVTARGTIRLDVSPEVSALDFAAGLNISGFTIPGLTSRKVQTEVELESGQSFAIGGLLDKRLTETIQKIPLLADIPLLGKLFQSKSVNKQNNELLVIVTPVIVDPLPRDQPTPQLPFGKFLGPDTMPGVPEAAKAPGPPVTTLPVETLLRSMQSENDMKLPEKRDLSSWPGSLGPSTTATPAAVPAAPAVPSAPAAPPNK